MSEINSSDDRPPEEHVTQRFEERRVTERFEPDQRATDRFEAPDAARAACGFSLVQGDVVGDRYRVEELIASTTGEAEIYRCIDNTLGEVVALKFYRANISPKQSVLERLHRLHHPNIVSILDFGTWAGRFYEISDFCAGGSLMDHMPFMESDLEHYVEEILDGLHYLHCQGIIHRDIKPNNLLFRYAGPRDVVLGDFGVSSFLSNEEKVRKTSTGAFFTLDYAAPELIDGKEVSSKTDYYAMGITLLHLLTGVSPFTGMDTNAILGCHFRGNVPRPDHISPKFRRLIDGLVRVRPDSRWGYGQVQSWLRGDIVMTDDGVPDHEEAVSGTRIPYRSNPNICTPSEMARRLDELDVARDLQRGYISQWMMFFDTKLGERIVHLEDEFADNPQLGMFKLRYILDPMQPLMVGGKHIQSLGGLVRLLDKDQAKYTKAVGALLYSQSLEVWIEALGTDHAAELNAKIRAIRERVQDVPLGVFALLQTLDPTRAFPLTDLTRIDRPEELESALSKNYGAGYRVSQLLFNGYIEEWLRASFPGRKNDIAFVAQCAKTYKEDRELGTFALRCRFCPELEFPIGTKSAGTPKELATVIQSTPEFFERGIRALSNNWIRVWLIITGRMQDPAPFDRIVTDFTLSWARRMEAVLHLLDPALPGPAVAADVESVDAGKITVDESRTTNICVFNASRGHLAGTITLAEDSEGFYISPHEIEGGPVNVRIIMSGENLKPGETKRTVLIVDTNGGRLEIPLQFLVSAPSKSIVMRTVGAGIITGEVFAFYRMILELIWPEYRYSVLPWFTLNDCVGHWYFIPLAVCFVTAMLGTAYYVYTFYRIHDL